MSEGVPSMGGGEVRDREGEDVCQKPIAVYIEGAMLTSQ